MFEKILIANRGEIAVRIVRTCRKLGVATVAVYSEADARSRHAEAADEAAFIGPAPAAESYLRADRILAAAREHGAAAIHPGYGFLAEDPKFAAAVADAGLVFIGPPAAAIARLGDKGEAKRLAAAAGVPVVPGVDEVPDLAAARAAADTIGYPVLLKPVAGGGGKGMKIVAEPGQLENAWRTAESEARKAFGDGRMLLEKFIARPRHVEVQIIADAHGRVLALPERECSIQRRCQKIIEESPSLAASPELRARLAEAAVRLARAAGYVNAGTVEFLLDPAGGFYFLEVNTRLQVEHPVTELVTGWDLVELQLRVAAGEPLPYAQEDVKLRGWAIEARICAEDPERNFLPSTGMITRYAEPRGKELRVDSGIRPGSQVTAHYDSLLAKVIAAGNTREAARARLIDALNGYHIEGPATNLVFVNAILNHPAFAAGRLDTNFIPEHMLAPAALPAPPEERLHYMAMAALLVFHNRQAQVKKSLQPMSTRVGAAPKPPREHLYFVRGGGADYEVRLAGEQKSRTWAVTVNRKTYMVLTPEFEFYRRRLKLTIDGAAQRFVVSADDNLFRIAYSGLERAFELYNAREWELLGYMPAPRPPEPVNVVTSPMPGLVVDVRVKPGESVASGQVLVVIESMKMESDVASVVDGEIEAVNVSPGQTVESGDILVKFKER